MLIEALLSSADRFPDRLAVADPFGMEVTYSRLVHLADVIKRAVEKGTHCERVGIFGPSSVGYVLTWYGIIWAGRAAVPLNLLLHPDELRRIIADAQIDLIVTGRFPPEFNHLNDVVDHLPVRKIVLDDLPLRQRTAGGDVAPSLRPPKVGPDDVAVILYTSGTSGEPKGVMLTHKNLDGNARGCIAHLRPGPDQRYLGVLPLFHSFGMTTMMVMPITLGASVFYIPRFQPAQVIKAIATQRSTMVYAIASMCSAMLRVKSATPEDFKSIEAFITGGEALPPELYKAWLERFGFPLLEGYGLTETSPVVSFNRPWANHPGTAGQLLPGVEARTIDEDGSPLPPGNTGEIAVRGSIVMKGYYNKPRETAAVLDKDGWFKTGDMGWVDAEGYVAITGRKKEMIIVSGENVYPREIEAVLERHPAVAESAVIPEKVGGTRGEVPVGFVILKEGHTTNDHELREFCRKHLPQYKVPKTVWIAEQLPRGPTGKILKRALCSAGPPRPAAGN